MKTLAHQSFCSGLQRWSVRVALVSVLAVSPLLTGNAVAQEFQSISINAAILYDGPSANSKRLFIAPRGMPVRVVTVAEPYVKVRDMGGDLAWVERRSLGSVRTLISLSTINLQMVAKALLRPAKSGACNLVAYSACLAISANMSIFQSCLKSRIQ
jgi:SH3-like domain-containing protein